MALSKIDSDGIVANGITADSLNIGQIGGRRNLIINGAMQVAQRGTSTAGVTSSGYYTVDRHRWSLSSFGTWTVEQSTDSPDGFSSSFKATCTTANTSPNTNSSLFSYYAFEGKDLQGLAYGSSNAKDITVSFWIKSNKTGNFQVNWKNVNSSKIISNVQTISSADTWEYKTVTFAGNTTNGFAFSQNKSAQLEMWFDSGSLYQTNPTQTTWDNIGSGESQAYGVDLDLGRAINNYVSITGVQLEVGSVATPFEHRSFGEELALCQRYANRLDDSGRIGAGTVGSSTECYVMVHLPVEMRASPSLTVNALGNVVKEGVAWYSNTAISVSGTATQGIALQTTQSNNNMSGQNSTQLGNGCDLLFDAEL